MTKPSRSSGIHTYAKPSAERSAIMRAVKSKNTKPEKAIRSLLHHMGLRFRLHKKDLPGRPDIFLKRYKLAIFVHGCFWHRHPGCKKATTPKSNPDFWNEKFSQNRKRDRQNIKALQKLGIRTLVIWECQIEKGENYLKKNIRK